MSDYQKALNDLVRDLPVLSARTRALDTLMDNLGRSLAQVESDFKDLRAYVDAIKTETIITKEQN